MRARLRSSTVIAFGLAGSLCCGSDGNASSFPAESFSKGHDILLTRTLVAQCTPLPCRLSGDDPVRVGALIKQGTPGDALDTRNVVCNPSQRTPLDINKEGTIEHPASDQDLLYLFHEAEKPREIIALIKSLARDLRWVASAVISESMVDVKQIRRALAAIPSECRKEAISRGFVTSIGSRKFGMLSLAFRVTFNSDIRRQLDELRLLLRENFELVVTDGEVGLYSKQPRLFSVQSISIDGFLKTHPILR